MDDDKRNEQRNVERQYPHVHQPWVDVPDEAAVLRMEPHDQPDEPEPEATGEDKPEQQGAPAWVKGQPLPLDPAFPDATSIYRLWNRAAHRASPYSATAISRAA